MEVQPLAVFAFRPHNAQHIRHPEVCIHGPHAPGLFHACSYAMFTDPWLGPKEAFTQAKIARVQPLGPGGFGQGEHIRRSGTDGVDPQLTNGLKQEGRLTHAKGDDGSSCGLQVLMIGEPAHPEAIIEAMYHRVAGAQPGSPEGTGGACIHEVTIARRESDIERTPRCARGFVYAHHLLLRGRQIPAKGRMLLLAAQTFVFLSKGEQRQIGYIADVFALHADFSELGLVESRTCPHVVKLRSQAVVLHLMQRCWLHRLKVWAHFVDENTDLGWKHAAFIQQVRARTWIAAISCSTTCPSAMVGVSNA